MHLLIRSRVDKPKLARVETLPVNESLMFGFKPRFSAAVDLVTHQGVSKVCHVNADLMRATRFENTFYSAKARIALEHLIMGHGTP